MKMYNYHKTWSEFNIAFSLYERNKLKENSESLENPKFYPFYQGPPQQLLQEKQCEIYDAKFNDAIQKKQVYQSFDFSDVETRHWNQKEMFGKIYPVKFDENDKKILPQKNPSNL